MLKKYYPGGFAGYDPFGCPVWLIPFGGADMRGDSFKIQRIVLLPKSMLYLLNRCDVPVTK